MPIFIPANDFAVIFLVASIDLVVLINCFSVLIAGRGHQHLSDKELIAKCSQKSSDWENFWREFQSRFGETILFYIYREFNKYSGQKFSDEVHEKIKDLRQDVYIKLLRNDAKALKNFQGKNENSFLAYLHVISKNLVKNHVNTSGFKKLVSMSKLKQAREQSGNLQYQPVCMDTVDKLEKSIFKSFITEKVKQCYHSRDSERDILLFKLFYFEGLTAKEIAKNSNFGLSSGGVETIVNRIIQCLRKNFKN